MRMPEAHHKSRATREIARVERRVWRSHRDRAVTSGENVRCHPFRRGRLRHLGEQDCVSTLIPGSLQNARLGIR